MFKSFRILSVSLILVLLLMMLFLMPFLLAVPFYTLELLIGTIQALIFGGLTLVFATMAVTSHEHEEA